jgi:hypothetical protein
MSVNILEFIINKLIFFCKTVFCDIAYAYNRIKSFCVFKVDGCFLESLISVKHIV